MKRTVAIDFDRTIHTYEKGWHDGTAYGGVIEGTHEALELLSKKYRLVIFSARVAADKSGRLDQKQVMYVRDWLKKYGLVKYFSDITCVKTGEIIAIIDDRAVHFDGNWNTALSNLKKIRDA